MVIEFCLEALDKSTNILDATASTQEDASARVDTRILRSKHARQIQASEVTISKMYIMPDTVSPA